MIEREQERPAGAPLVMIELPPPPPAQDDAAAEAPASTAAPSPASSSSSRQRKGFGIDLYALGRMTRREWTLRRTQQMALLRGQVLYDTSWMSSDAARRLHRSRRLGSLLICAELLVALAAGIGLAGLVHLVLMALIA